MGGERGGGARWRGDSLVSGRALGIGALLLGAALAQAGEPQPAKPAQDEDLLEFLGSVDDGDAGWSNYLAKTDIAKVAKPVPPKTKPAAPRPQEPQGQSDNR
jgi:hypothetical protein